MDITSLQCKVRAQWLFTLGVSIVANSYLCLKQYLDNMWPHIMTSMEPHMVTSSYRFHNDNTMTSNVEQWVNIMLTVISSSCRIMRSHVYVILMSYIAMQKNSFSTSQWYIIPISYHDVTETMSNWHHKLLLYLGVIFCQRFILPYKNTIIWFTLRHPHSACRCR